MSDDDDVTRLHLNTLVARAEAYARWLYDGVETPHRSCGIAIAEVFGQETKPYQALRRGGITGCGECGAIKAGELVLGALLGDPDPTGSVTDALRRAAVEYRARWSEQLGLHGRSIVCNDLTASFDDFRSPERHARCTELAAVVARCVAQTLAEVDPACAAWSVHDREE